MAENGSKMVALVAVGEEGKTEDGQGWHQTRLDFPKQPCASPANPAADPRLYPNSTTVLVNLLFSLIKLMRHPLHMATWPHGFSA